MSTYTSEPDSRDAQLLIPEARQHQHRRYLRTGALALLAALAVAALISFAVAATARPAASDRSSSRGPGAIALTAAGPVLVRPVLCSAPAHATGVGAPGPLPTSCPRLYAQTLAGLGVTPVRGGYTSNSPPPDPALAPDPTSTRDRASSIVLVKDPAPSAPSGPRLLLGPSVLQLSRSTVGAAVARQTQTGAWVVDVRLDTSGASSWDAVAHRFFHTQLAIDLGGRAVSVPLIEPTSRAFSTFDGKLVISGELTRSVARELASALRVAIRP
jgi:hypothetical protein